MGGLPANKTVNGFAVDAEKPRVMYAAMRDGIFKSTNGGNTWEAVGRALNDVAAVTVNPRKAVELYASTTGGAVFVSTDGGVTWRRQQ